jgi:hypothetical protein
LVQDCHSERGLGWLIEEQREEFLQKRVGFPLAALRFRPKEEAALERREEDDGAEMATYALSEDKSFLVQVEENLFKKFGDSKGCLGR